MRKFVTLSVLLVLLISLCSCSLGKSEPIAVEDGTGEDNQIIIIDKKDDEEKQSDTPADDPTVDTETPTFTPADDLAVILEDTVIYLTPSLDEVENIAATVIKDSEFIITGYAAEGWSKIKYTDAECYIPTEKIKVTYEKASGSLSAKNGRLNLREKATTASKIMGTVDAKIELPILRKSVNKIGNYYWYTVDYNGTECYAREDVVNVKADN